MACGAMTAQPCARCLGAGMLRSRRAIVIPLRPRRDDARE